MMKTVVRLPHTRAQAEHAEEVTARLHDEGPMFVEGVNLGLDLTEKICPACALAQHEGGFSWGVCRDCFATALG